MLTLQYRCPTFWEGLQVVAMPAVFTDREAPGESELKATDERRRV